MFKRYVRFVRGVSVNWPGRIGVVLTTSSFITFIILEMARLSGMLNNAYVGLVTYMVFPALFIIGLILIPIGLRIYKQRTGKTTKQLLNERFDEEEVKGRFGGSKVFLTIGILTVINVVFMGVLSSRMLHFMDSAYFCGTACHTVMNPEWVTYQQSPHARVNCVECHVGEGVDALIDSKLNGLYQILSVTFNLYEKPIPTPVHQLRPARETCEKCHWPEKFYGQRIKTIVRHDNDSLSTPAYTTLALKVDVGTEAASRGIHWHIAEENEIRYTSVDDQREEMIEVQVRQPDGSFRTYRNTRLEKQELAEVEPRVMDCVDCHNRATHIYQRLEDAIDQMIVADELSRQLPFVKEMAMEALTVTYQDTSRALSGIADFAHNFYNRNHPQTARNKTALIDRAVIALKDSYRRNIHPYMNISWGAYPSFIGHHGEGGCFRCHNDYMLDSAGESIAYDCTMCHSMLAYEDEERFINLQPADTAHMEYQLRAFLKREFRSSLGR
ncbi:MAG: hypothetical protein GF404_05890 [candidate division Zixibacteria bacterium]|nr:hypothetical protein [candidate division Zixibacteria bacterium]